MRVLKPDTEAEIQEAIRDASAANTPLAIEGGGSKSAFGRAVVTDTILRLAGHAGITMYEPDEMVFTARAGTPLHEIEQALAARGQCLGFEPADWAALWDKPQGRATIGGTIAAAINGPRRFAAGAARDHLLGFVAINGKGERFKAGGRVVKNVTGYDLPKLAAGSFGTLMVLTEVTLRALPRGTSTTILAVEGPDAAESLALTRAVAASPFDSTGLVVLPPAAAQRLTGKTCAISLIRLEGQAEGVAARAAELCRTIAKAAYALGGEEGQKLFRDAAQVHPCFADGSELWRVSLPPAAAPGALARFNPGSWIADWAGGLLWLEEPAVGVHEIARDLGGHATLVRAKPNETSDDIFPPLDAATMNLTRRLKAAFDPARILNPGRMYKDV